jgi:hypothetical protein
MKVSFLLAHIQLSIKGFIIGIISLMYIHFCYTLESYMLCDQLYLLCALFICVVLLTYYKIKYPLQHVLL